MEINGNYFPFPNELQDKLYTIRIPGEARQIFDVILRKTIGWANGDGERKKSERISLSQFANLTGINKKRINYLINQLVNMKIITKNGDGNLVSYKINNKLEEWKSSPKKMMTGKTSPKMVMSITKNGDGSSPKMVTHDSKETRTKETSTKKEGPSTTIKGPVRARARKEHTLNTSSTPVQSVENTTSQKFDDIHLKMAHRLRDDIDIFKPNHAPITQGHINSWANTFRLMMVVDKISIDRIRDVFKWLNSNGSGAQFWRPNIRSADKLRKHFDTLELRMAEDRKPKQQEIDSGGRHVDDYETTMKKLRENNGGN